MLAAFLWCWACATFSTTDSGIPAPGNREPNAPRATAPAVPNAGPPSGAGGISFKLRDSRQDPRAFVRALRADHPEFATAHVLRVNRLGIVDLDLAADATGRAVALLEATGECEFAETNGVANWLSEPNDPLFPAQWNLANTGQSGGVIHADVDASGAFDLEDGDRSIVVAVIDTGVELDHPDLFANLWVNEREIASNGIDDDGNGFVDDVRGWDFGDDDNGPEPGSRHGGVDPHGTMVAGIVGAVGNNGLGMTGLAGGGRDSVGCRLMPLKILGAISPAACLDDAILYAVDNGAKVITLSLAIAPSHAVELALAAADAAGVFIDAGAGNSGGIAYPAASAFVTAVGGTDASDRPSTFSAGPQMEIAAPALFIVTTTTGHSYTVGSGTSMAAPQVAATAALLFSQNRALTVAQVRSILRESSDDVATPGFDAFTGYGRLDVHRSLELGRRAIAPSVRLVGSGSVGRNGLVPVIGTNGVPPCAGAHGAGIFVGNVTPNEPGFLFLGAARSSSLDPVTTLVVDLASIHCVIPVVTDAKGEVGVAGDLPPDPRLAGTRVYAQFVGCDALAEHGFAASRGLEITIGSLAAEH